MMTLFAWLVFMWIMVGATRELIAWPTAALARLFVALRVLIALLLLLVLLGVFGGGRFA